MSKEVIYNEVNEQHAMIGNVTKASKENFKRTKHPEAQWFPEAGLGLFLHMGISSVSGECDLSWGMIKKEMNRKRDIDSWGLFATHTNPTPVKYWAMAKDYAVDKFDPEKILAAAKKAGFRYAVLTTKHHDGFCLWPSKFGDLNIGQYQPGRDIVHEFIEACRKTGIKAGLYYSPPDLHFNRSRMSFNYGDRQPPLDMNHKPIVLPAGSNKVQASEGNRPAYLPFLTADEAVEMDRRFNELVRGHVTELLTNYGKVDIIWFDGEFPQYENTMTMDELRALQPGMLINPRALGYGDFATSECRFPDKRHTGWWEYCHVGYDGGWGYRDHDGYKPAGWLLAEFVKARAWGGNFLPDYGPDAHGELPEVYYKRMAQIGCWMEKHAESVFGVEPGPWPEHSNVPVTIKGNTWYAFFDYLNDGMATLTGVKNPVEVKLLSTGVTVPFTFTAGTLELRLPEELRTTLVDVVAVTY